MFVDTAPVMEKPLAEAAGHRLAGQAHQSASAATHGSWLFLGAIYTTLELAPDAPARGSIAAAARACLDACPTDAFPAPFRLDARRCISYLTIEHKGPIPEEFREAIGNRIYGCDDCLAVCPWNRFADAAAGQPGLPAARRAGRAARWPTCWRSTMPAFRKLFAGSPIKRIGRDRMVRNAAIAAGNSGASRAGAGPGAADGGRGSGRGRGGGMGAGAAGRSEEGGSRAPGDPLEQPEDRLWGRLEWRAGNPLTVAS